MESGSSRSSPHLSRLPDDCWFTPHVTLLAHLPLYGLGRRGGVFSTPIVLDPWVSLLLSLYAAHLCARHAFPATRSCFLEGFPPDLMYSLTFQIPNVVLVATLPRPLVRP